MYNALFHENAIKNNFEKKIYLIFMLALQLKYFNLFQEAIHS